ncbi:MAG: hypothetical protein QXU99_05740 [Candidatus Bathyarchaeia archaeon]
MVEEERQKFMPQKATRLIAKFHHSKKALAIPTTFIILFVTTLGLIAITYYFAVEKVNARGVTLKVASAKQDMQEFGEVISQVIGQPGSARTFEFSDSGGKLHIQPSANTLTVNITDNGDIAATVFNQAIGQVVYELPYSDSPDTGLFLKGDSRTITNQSGATQLYIRRGTEHAEIVLRYRPIASYTTAGVQDGKLVNNIRIYIINLNASESIALFGKLPLKVCCISTQLTTTTYELSYIPETLVLTSTLDEDSGRISIPLSSTAQGAIINIELIICNITIQKWVK